MAFHPTAAGLAAEADAAATQEGSGREKTTFSRAQTPDLFRRRGGMSDLVFRCS